MQWALHLAHWSWMGVAIRCRLDILLDIPSAGRNPQLRAPCIVGMYSKGLSRFGFSVSACAGQITHYSTRAWRGRDGGRNDGTEDWQARDQPSYHGSPDAEYLKAVSDELAKRDMRMGKQRRD